MTFIQTIPPEEAEGVVAQQYEGARASLGRLPNFVQAFSLRPGVFAAWLQLNGAIKENMDLRRYELATLAAARRLRSTYCMLAHSSVLTERFFESDALRSVALDHHAAGLDEIDVAVMDLADKVVTDATSVTQADIDRLRGLGLSDADVTDVVLAATARCFLAKTVDALGAQADAKYAQLDEPLREALTVGRPISEA